MTLFWYDYEEIYTWPKVLLDLLFENRFVKKVQYLIVYFKITGEF